jgi:hypothetical protein
LSLVVGFVPDGSGKPFEEKCCFLPKRKRDQRKRFAVCAKRHFLKKLAAYSRIQAQKILSAKIKKITRKLEEIFGLSAIDLS